MKKVQTEEALSDAEQPLNSGSTVSNRKPPPETMAARRKNILTVLLIVLLCVGIVVVVAVLTKMLLDNYYYFCRKSFKFIKLESVCDGIPDCADSEDEKQCVMNVTFQNAFEVRIDGPKSLLQVYSPASQTWRLVCFDNWNDSLAQVTCNQLGYTRNPRATAEQLNASEQKNSNFSVVNTLKATNPKKIQDALEEGSCKSGTVVSLVCSNCGETGLDRIVGGNDTTIEHWPWQVSLQYNGQHTCGGSIISPSWIVAAAHCFPSDHQQTEHWKVGAGITTLSSSGSVPVSKIFINGQFSSRTNDYDIALMKLSSPLKFREAIRAVCLPNYNQEVPAGSDVWVTGWGYTREHGTVSTTLQRAKISLIAQNVCNRGSVYGSLITSRMLCAGFLEGNVDACQGDSGGPLVYEDIEDGEHWYLTGIVSWGFGCARAMKPGVYTKVVAFLDWIYNVMQQNP